MTPCHIASHMNQRGPLQSFREGLWVQAICIKQTNSKHSLAFLILFTLSTSAFHVHSPSITFLHTSQPDRLNNFMNINLVDS